jgi:deoxyribodipyrimidine photo-lyase
VDYNYKRNWLSWETSRLSPHIRWGTISLRRCYYAAVLSPQHEWDGVKSWAVEMAWRDFFQTILWFYPAVIKQNFRSVYDTLAWENNPDYFAAWCEGRTGYPVVDAAMRQLKATGWMHNRSRMVVASFLCKDLHIDWRWGEQYFMQMLIDGDTAANNGGWQWAAGTGTDSAPYFRVFNPVSQSTLYDKFGNYIRRWVAELDGLPYQLVHTPWHLPPEKRRLIDYPERIVDHIVERKRAIAMYKAAREAASAAFFESQINGVLSGEEEDINMVFEDEDNEDEVE